MSRALESRHVVTSSGPDAAPGQPFISMVKPSAISTGQLKSSHSLHFQPINLVVFQGPSSPEGEPKPDLGEGFALRCLQRLTCPGLATQRCP